MRRPGFTLPGLGLNSGRGEVASGDGAIETNPLVGAIAEGLVAGMAAPAKPDGFASGEAEWLAVLIDNFKIAFNAYWAAIGNSDFGASQGSLRGTRKFLTDVAAK
jgi:hypothetical protein